jgi:hypothetical protein
MAIDLDEQDGQTPLDPDELAALIPLGQGSYGLSMSVKKRASEEARSNHQACPFTNTFVVRVAQPRRALLQRYK